MPEPTNAPDRRRLLADEAAELAAHCKALHRRIVSLEGDDDGLIGGNVGAPTWSSMAQRCLEHTADELTHRQPVTHEACGHRHAPGTPCPEVGR